MLPAAPLMSKEPAVVVEWEIEILVSLDGLIIGPIPAIAESLLTLFLLCE